MRRSIFALKIGTRVVACDVYFTQYTERYCYSNSEAIRACVPILNPLQKLLLLLLHRGS